MGASFSVVSSSSLVGQEISLDASVSFREICRMVCWDFGLVQAIVVKRMSKSGGLIEAGGGESEKKPRLEIRTLL